MKTLFPVINDFFNDGFFQPTLSPLTKVPKVNIKESADQYSIEAELPGVDKKDVNLSYDNGYFKIDSKLTHKLDNKDDQYHRREFYSSSFQRSFYLGDVSVDFDKISAAMENGILTVTIPKSEKAKSKLIEIK